MSIEQKMETQLKLQSSTDSQSYIPGSLQNRDPILAPNYLKDNQGIEAIVKEGHELNEAKKQEFAEII